MTDTGLSCQEFVELVTEYLEGTLPIAERVRFEAHLDLCNGCEIYLQQISKTIQWLGKLTEADISEDAKDIQLKTFRDWKISLPPVT